MPRSKIVLFLVISLILSACLCTPHRHSFLRQAHAHNDYDHPRPLFDALAYGFTSFEVDVFLKNENLYVAHDPEDIQENRTLQSLYLDPLYELFSQNNGTIYPQWPTVYLMIDIKSDADSTFTVLQPILLRYAGMITSWNEGDKNEKAVTVLLSGNRPIQTLSASSDRLAGLDGRISDLQNGEPAELFPWISDNWISHFAWRGVGEMSDADKLKLSSIVHEAHRNGQLVRFWSTDFYESSARLALWNVLLENGVDLINTDDLAGLADFLHGIKR